MHGGEIHIRRWVATVVVIAALVGGVFLASGLRHWTGREIVGAATLPVTVEHNAAAVPLGNFKNGFASVLEPVLPAVVNIHSSKVIKQRQGTLPFFNDPFFQQFFGNQGMGQMQQPQSEREESLGSGVIVTSDGTILTNNHVVEGATDIKVDLSDKREFTAKVIGTDSNTDIAVLKIDATDLPTMKFGNSSDLHVGDIVLAVGDPYGIGETATMGIVSATGRSGLGIEGYEDFIQTDAAINPGNSGGALVNLNGDLVGINTAILSNGDDSGMGGEGGNEGIGFAIPINMAHNVMDQLVSHGKVIRGYLGLLPETVTESLAKQFGLSQPGGAVVAQVEPNTPAAKAGIKQGDVILQVNGKPVNSANDLRLEISQTTPGTTVNLQVSRDGKTMTIPVVLGTFPEETANNSTPGQGGETSTAGLKGVKVQNLTSDLSQQLGLPSSVHGVVITSVDPDSAAASTEPPLDRGCVIEEVNHKPVTDIQSYEQAIASAGSQPVLLLVYFPAPNGQGGPQYVVVQPQQ
ncbi:MAG TPA: DegQ family serine endoprotease [Candidatus Aquilonibacter sp.]|nr:DegQ family serine endoprotease [Candidatus Aquilonibacter sp.]